MSLCLLFDVNNREKANNKDPILSEFLQMNNMSNHDNTDFTFSGNSDQGYHRMDSFNNWDNDPNFNLLDFINEEEHDSNNSLNNQEDPKDKIFKNWQYNQIQFGGNGSHEEFENALQNMRTPMLPAAVQQANTSYDNNNFYGYATSSAAGYPSSSSSNFPVKTEEPFMEEDLFPNVMDDFPPADATPVSINKPNLNGTDTALRSSLRTPKPNPRFLQNLPYVDPVAIEQRVNQATKKPPRKYRIKPDTEKVNPVYKQKREKNNDAVRRSREKAKALQAEKETRLMHLEKEYTLLSDRYRKLLQYYRDNCRCNIKHPKDLYSDMY